MGKNLSKELAVKKYAASDTIDEKLTILWNSWLIHVDNHKGVSCPTSLYLKFHEKIAGDKEVFDVADEDITPPPFRTYGIRPNERYTL